MHVSEPQRHRHDLVEPRLKQGESRNVDHVRGSQQHSGAQMGQTGFKATVGDKEKREEIKGSGGRLKGSKFRNSVLRAKE